VVKVEQKGRIYRKVSSQDIFPFAQLSFSLGLPSVNQSLYTTDRWVNGIAASLFLDI